MPTFTLQQDFQGYVRGHRRMTVEADSIEEAEAMWCGCTADFEIVRDDTHKDDLEIEEDVPYEEPTQRVAAVTGTMALVRSLLGETYDD